MEHNPDFVVFSDPHIGKVLKSNTTPEGRASLSEATNLTAFNLVKRWHSKNVPIICNGDMFDKAHNSEAVLLSGMAVLTKTYRCLAGNHDVTPKAGAVTSLEAASRLMPDEHLISMAPYGEVRVEQFTLKSAEGSGVKSVHVMVPHHTTGELFRKALAQATELVTAQVPGDVATFLHLHCDYNADYGNQNEQAQNLSIVEAKELLDSGFDFILIGHDHRYRTDFGGRLIILGNTYPTGFGDLGVKYEHHFSWKGDMDKSTGRPLYTHTPVELVPDLRLDLRWSPDLSVEELDCRGKFVTLEGSLKPDEALKLSKTIKALRQQNPYALRSTVEVEALSTPVKAVTQSEFRSLWQLIMRDLEAEGRQDLVALANTLEAAKNTGVNHE